MVRKYLQCTGLSPAEPDAEDTDPARVMAGEKGLQGQQNPAFVCGGPVIDSEFSTE